MARVKHGQDDWLSYHLTTRTLDGELLLASPTEKHKIVAALAHYRAKGHYRLFGFVVMSNHLHFVVQPTPGTSLSTIARDIKTWTSIRNATKPPNCPLWERRFDDNRIKSTEELWNVLKYIHNNPVRAGIVSRPDDYEWSSFHNYLGNGQAAIEIDSDWWQY
ncbi:MAG: REP-associated tyrosine transposase [Planctomycetota bacterium]|jgi:REP element-mobilizing transposase RayT